MTRLFKSIFFFIILPITQNIVIEKNNKIVITVSHLFRTSPTSNFIPWEVNKPLPTDIHNLASRGFHVTTRLETRVKKKSLANFRETFPNTDQYLAEENVLLKPLVSIDKLIRQPIRSLRHDDSNLHFLLFSGRERERDRRKKQQRKRKLLSIVRGERYITFQTFNRLANGLNVCGVGGVPRRDSDRGNDFSTFSGNQEVRRLRERIGRLPDALDPALAPKLVENPATFSGSWTTILVLNGDPHTHTQSCYFVIERFRACTRYSQRCKTDVFRCICIYIYIVTRMYACAGCVM